MPITTIRAATSVEDNSIVYDTITYGVPTILRGGKIVAQESQKGLSFAAKAVLKIRSTGAIPANLKLAAIDGGLALFGRLIGGVYLLSDQYFTDLSVEQFIQATYGGELANTGWNVYYSGDYRTTMSEIYDYIFFEDAFVTLDKTFIRNHLTQTGICFHPRGSFDKSGAPVPLSGVK